MKNKLIASFDRISWLHRVKEVQVPADKQFNKKKNTPAIHILHGKIAEAITKAKEMKLKKERELE